MVIVALAKLKLDSLGDTLAMKKVKGLVDALAEKLKEADVETHGNTEAHYNETLKLLP